MEERCYAVYVMTNPGHTVLYIGMTNDLIRRVSEHKEGSVPGFTQKYRCNQLIYFETSDEVMGVIEREKELKGWSRLKKEALIATMNPQWLDLYPTLFT